MFKYKKDAKKYYKKYYLQHRQKCQKCGKLIGEKIKSKLCRSCCRLGKKHHNYKNGANCHYKKYYCKNCGKRIKRRAKRCKSCARRGNNNPAIKANKYTIIKHHIYLRENGGKILELTRSKHTQLHIKAYEYIYKRFGKTGIKDYIEWFDRKYKLRFTIVS